MEGVCLICCQTGENSLMSSGSDGEITNPLSPSCAASLCAIFGMTDDYTLKTLYEECLYCNECFKEIRRADLMMGELEMLRQNLLRFQQRMYNKLGNNYFQLEDMSSRTLRYDDIVQIITKNGCRLSGVNQWNKLSYEDFVKVAYEKLDNSSCRWERFSSCGLSVSPKTTTTQKIRSSKKSKKDCLNSNGKFSKVKVVRRNGKRLNEEQLSSRKLTCSPGKKEQKVLSDVGGTKAVAPSFNKVIENFEKIYCRYDPDKCKRYFFDNYNLEIHIQSFHLGIRKPHECQLCKKRFLDEKRLKSHHERVHIRESIPGPASFSCDHCGKQLADHRRLRTHLRTHIGIGELRTICKFCDAKYKTPAELWKHEQQHSVTDSPFTCVFCPTVVTHSTALKAHTRSEHFPPSPQTLFSCPICPKAFVRDTSLKIHMNVHGTEYKCEKCSYIASSMSALNTHKTSHSKERSHECNICGATFKYLKNLTSHVQTHRVDKHRTFKCPICSKAFIHKSYLKRHEESHSKKSNYSCSTCEKEFKVKENFRKHEKLHQGQKSIQDLKQPSRKINSRKVKRNIEEFSKSSSKRGKRGSKSKVNLKSNNSPKKTISHSSMLSADIEGIQKKYDYAETSYKQKFAKPQDHFNLNLEYEVDSCQATVHRVEESNTEIMTIQYPPSMTINPEITIPESECDYDPTQTFIIMQPVNFESMQPQPPAT